MWEGKESLGLPSRVGGWPFASQNSDVFAQANTVCKLMQCFLTFFPVAGINGQQRIDQTIHSFETLFVGFVGRRGAFTVVVLVRKGGPRTQILLVERTGQFVGSDRGDFSFGITGWCCEGGCTVWWRAGGRGRGGGGAGGFCKVVQMIPSGPQRGGKCFRSQ